MIGRCKSCCHWQAPYRPSSAYYYPGWRACELAFRNWFPIPGTNQSPGSTPLAVEAGHEAGDLLTAPEFGCVAFTAHQETTDGTD